jgi:hypothetical protein
MALVRIPNSNFMRDTTNMALLPIDNTQKNDYMSKMAVIKNQKDEINKVKEEIASIRGDVSDIKSLLQQLIGKGSNG